MPAKQKTLKNAKHPQSEMSKIENEFLIMGEKLTPCHVGMQAPLALFLKLLWTNKF
jgi:hypothetical protein